MCDEKWVLTRTVTIKEDDPDRNLWRAEDESWEFADFAEAREAFRRVARECATSRSNVFDGDGNIRSLQELFDALSENLEEQRRNPQPNHSLGNMILRAAPEVAIMAGDFESARAMPSALRSWLLDMGAYDRNPLPEFKWTDWGYGIVSKPGSLAMGSLSDIDRIESYDAQIYADAFDMSEPDRAYEFSVRAYFDCYDMDAGSLRIRLCPGKPDDPGRFIWPEEREFWPYCSCMPAAPCLEGEIDGSCWISVGARPKASFGKAERAQLYEGYELFFDGIAELAKERGLAVDKDTRKTVFRNICCYRAGEDGPWFVMRIQARFDDDSRGSEDAPIWVEGECFEGYADALEEVGWLIDEYMAGNIPPGEEAREYQQRRRESSRGA